MVKNWIKRILGIEELENKVNNIEKQKASLESKLIESENEKSMVANSVSKSVISQEIDKGVEQFLQTIDIGLTNQNSGAILTALEAKDVVEKYNFKRYSPPQEIGYNSPIISMEEFQKHPEKYLYKISKGFFNFPIGLNFDEINKALEKRFSNIGMENSILKKVGISFVPRLLFDYYDEGTAKVSELLIQSTELSHLRRSNCGAWIHMDNLDFLSNFKGITEFIKDSSRISKKSKTQAISALEFIRFSYLTAMEIVGKSRIKNVDDLLKYDSGKELEVINTGVQKYFGEDPAYKLK